MALPPLKRMDLSSAAALEESFGLMAWRPPTQAPSLGLVGSAPAGDSRVR